MQLGEILSVLHTVDFSAYVLGTQVSFVSLKQQGENLERKIARLKAMVGEAERNQSTAKAKIAELEVAKKECLCTLHMLNGRSVQLDGVDTVYAVKVVVAKHFCDANYKERLMPSEIILVDRQDRKVLKGAMPPNCEVDVSVKKENVGAKRRRLEAEEDGVFSECVREALDAFLEVGDRDGIRSVLTMHPAKTGNAFEGEEVEGFVASCLEMIGVLPCDLKNCFEKLVDAVREVHTIDAYSRECELRHAFRTLLCQLGVSDEDVEFLDAIYDWSASAELR